MAIDIGMLLQTWDKWGVFDFVLPFLLIFAIVFGILTSTELLGKNKGVHVIIALVVSALALRLPFVSVFFTELFPRLGVGLAVIIALAILTGLFIQKDDRWAIYVFMGIGAIIWIVALSGAFQESGLWGKWGSFGVTSEDLVALVIGAVLLIGVIIAVVMARTPENSVKEIKLFRTS
ncbi:MAG: hypothetical protein N3D20_01480 [Candidatus Pacearchaeota archaeon]|nr:hypothetical protein [Candidatus Pacearchaeota archaeon]